MSNRARAAVPDRAAVTPLLAFVLALGCGAIAANLYYAQPLAALIAADFAIPSAASGFVVTLTQIGYGLGLLFVVPLGDIVENRRLVVTMTLLAGCALLFMATTASATGFMAGALALGAASTVVQILLPYSAQISPDAMRGRVIGILTSGLMAGIALARPLASLITASLGWHGIFVLSGLAMALMALVLAMAMPQRQPETPLRYGSMLRSLPGLLRDIPVLRRRAAYHTMLYASFSLFWIAIPLQLGSDEFGLTQRGIGFFGLAGATGIVVAPLAGWIADRGLTRPGTAGAMLAMLAAFAITLIAWYWHSIALLVLGAILVDAGLVINFVLSQRAIYEPRPGSRSRIGGLFTAIFFCGGATGSLVGSASFSAGGWPLTGGIGVALAILALAMFRTERRDC
jgi:predicted MFS family arabinose efflux permease